MTPEILVSQLEMSKQYLDRATAVLTEEDSAFAPTNDAFTVAQQVAHTAKVVDWFVAGAFGAGFDMDFEKFDVSTRTITSLKEARTMCDRSYQRAMEIVGGKTQDEIVALLPEGPIMGGAPKFAIVAGIVEHTAHHRGALSVYTRLCGKVPAMPYM